MNATLDRNDTNEIKQIEFQQFLLDTLAREPKLSPSKPNQEVVLAETWNRLAGLDETPYGQKIFEQYQEEFDLRQALMSSHNSNMIYEYRFEQTPTLLLVLPRQREQTNHVIR